MILIHKRSYSTKWNCFILTIRSNIILVKPDSCTVCSVRQSHVGRRRVYRPRLIMRVRDCVSHGRRYARRLRRVIRRCRFPADVRMHRRRRDLGRVLRRVGVSLVVGARRRVRCRHLWSLISCVGDDPGTRVWRPVRGCRCSRDHCRLLGHISGGCRCCCIRRLYS
jgi:hypothetical protein